MYYSYQLAPFGCKPPALGLYQPKNYKTGWRSVVVTHDPAGGVVALSEDKESIRRFSEECQGYYPDREIYKLSPSADYWM
jgi:hypothetical protein